jgi:hypothetical protein
MKKYLCLTLVIVLNHSELTPILTASDRLIPDPSMNVTDALVHDAFEAQQ